MTNHVIALLELISATAMVIALLALAGIVLVTLLGAVGSVAERAGDRWQQALERVAYGGHIVAGWLRSGVTVLDLLAAALTGQSPSHYVERRRQAGTIGRQTGLSAGDAQTDQRSARQNDDNREPSPPLRPPLMPVMRADAPQAARMPASPMQPPARTVAQPARSDAATDAQIIRLLRAYRTADVVAEALLLAGWGVGQVRSVVRMDNNRVSAIAARVTGRREDDMEASDGMEQADVADIPGNRRARQRTLDGGGDE